MPFPIPSASGALDLSQYAPRLVALANEIVLQRFDGLCCVSCHSLLAVVSDEDGLLRLGNGNTLTALRYPVRTSDSACSLSRQSKGGRDSSYLAGVGAAIFGLGEHVALTGDVQALGEGLVDGGFLAGHNACEVLHLLGADLSIASWSASCVPLNPSGPPSDLVLFKG